MIFAPEIQWKFIKGEKLPSWSLSDDVMRIPVNIFDGDTVAGGGKSNLNAYLVGGSLVITDMDTDTIVGVSRDFLHDAYCPRLCALSSNSGLESSSAPVRCRRDG